MSAPDIPLDNINVDLDLDLTVGGTMDVGLGALANALTTGVKANVKLDELKADLKADLKLAEVKADLKAGIDAGLDNIRLNHLPVVQVSAAITDLPTIRTDSKVDLGLDDIRIREFPTIKLEFSMKPARVHLPLNYSFCIQVFGIRLFTFSICGEGMAITEDYTARATERC